MFLQRREIKSFPRTFHFTLLPTTTINNSQTSFTFWGSHGPHGILAPASALRADPETNVQVPICEQAPT